jgi:hypothetical protein
MRSRKKRRLSQQALQDAGVRPGLMVHRIGPDGRARLGQIKAEGSEVRLPSLFFRRASNNCLPQGQKGG